LALLTLHFLFSFYIVDNMRYSSIFFSNE
jgi:hypothetical protein